MVAVPASLVVQSYYEEVLSLQPPEHLLPVAAASQRVAQRGAHTFEHGGPQQEPPHAFGLAFEDLLGQEVDDVAVAPREGSDEARDVLALAHGEGGQLEGGDPALRDLLERRDVLGGEVQAYRASEEG